MRCPSQEDKKKNINSKNYIYSGLAKPDEVVEKGVFIEGQQWWWWWWKEVGNLMERLFKV